MSADEYCVPCQPSFGRRCGLLDWSLVRMGALCRTWSLHPKTQAKLHHELFFSLQGYEFSELLFLGTDWWRSRENFCFFRDLFVVASVSLKHARYIPTCLKPVIAKQIIPPKGIVIPRRNIANSKATSDEKSETISITTTNQQTGEYICLFYSLRWAWQNSEFCVPVSLCLTSFCSSLNELLATSVRHSENNLKWQAMHMSARHITEDAESQKLQGFCLCWLRGNLYGEQLYMCSKKRCPEFCRCLGICRHCGSARWLARTLKNLSDGQWHCNWQWFAIFFGGHIVRIDTRIFSRLMIDCTWNILQRCEFISQWWPTSRQCEVFLVGKLLIFTCIVFRWSLFRKDAATSTRISHNPSWNEFLCI